MFSISATSSVWASSRACTSAGTVSRPGELRGAPAALARDELVACRRRAGAPGRAAGRRAPAASRPAPAARSGRTACAAARVGRDQLDGDVAQLGRPRPPRRSETARIAARPRPMPRRSATRSHLLGQLEVRVGPAQCGSWWITGRPKLGASPTRTLRGITVSKTRSGKCSRTSRSTSRREARAPVVHRQQHARDGQARVELALDQRERVEQPGEALEREVLGLHRDDHAVGRDERVDRQRPERRRAVEQHVGEAVAHAGQRVAQPVLGARLRAAARRSRRRDPGGRAAARGPRSTSR